MDEKLLDLEQFLRAAGGMKRSTFFERRRRGVYKEGDLFFKDGKHLRFPYPRCLHVLERIACSQRRPRQIRRPGRAGGKRGTGPAVDTEYLLGE